MGGAAKAETQDSCKALAGHQTRPEPPRPQQTTLILLWPGPELGHLTPWEMRSAPCSPSPQGAISTEAAPTLRLQDREPPAQPQG